MEMGGKSSSPPPPPPLLPIASAPTLIRATEAHSKPNRAQGASVGGLFREIVLSKIPGESVAIFHDIDLSGAKKANASEYDTGHGDLGADLLSAVLWRLAVGANLERAAELTAFAACFPQAPHTSSLVLAGNREPTLSPHCNRCTAAASAYQTVLISDAASLPQMLRELCGAPRDEAAAAAAPRFVVQRFDSALDPDLAWAAARAWQRFEEPQWVASSRCEAEGEEKGGLWSEGCGDGDSRGRLRADERAARLAAGVVRFVCVSDTHGKHRDVSVPDGDVFVHAGDFSDTGEPHQVQDLERWIAALPGFSLGRMVIAGNHDVTFDEQFYRAAGAQRFHRYKKVPVDAQATKALLTGSAALTYLEDCAVDVPVPRPPQMGGGGHGTIRLWGCPWQPEFNGWAFNLPRGAECRQAWARIPSDTHVLVTHGPPLGRGDVAAHKARCGCVDLLRTVQSAVNLRAHIFGHVHEGYGVSFDGNTA
jgi:hypothetical protein